MYVTLSLSPCTAHPFIANPVNSLSIVMIGKGAYLKQLTAATLQMKSVTVGKDWRAVLTSICVHRESGITLTCMPVL